LLLIHLFLVGNLISYLICKNSISTYNTNEKDLHYFFITKDFYDRQKKRAVKTALFEFLFE
jgi:hypothetical protein